jgi:hypothetical protein
MHVRNQEFEEVARRAWEIYDRDLRAVVEPDHTGKFLTLDVTVQSGVGTMSAGASDPMR